MAAPKFNKKKAVKRGEPLSKRKKKDELFTPKHSKEEDVDYDVSDGVDEEEVENGVIDGDEEGSGSGSDVSSDGDDPLANDFLQGSDEGDCPFCFVFFSYNEFFFLSCYLILWVLCHFFYCRECLKFGFRF